MSEHWAMIEEFPNYKISNHGRVVNSSSGKILNTSMTRTGLVKVGMVLGGVQYTRSVALLVAEAFVPKGDEKEDEDLFDTPIHLDGDRENNSAINLMWRPRWFAWKWNRQFVNPRWHDRGPVIDLTTGVWYITIGEASRLLGILEESIWESILFKNDPNPRPTWPFQKTFSFRE